MVLQQDQKIVVGGYFTSLGGGGTGTTVRNRIGRLNANGSLDTSFGPGANGPVYALAVQTDERILVGGYFTTLADGVIGTTPRSNIGRVYADGSIDTSFDPGANSYVYALGLQTGGKILVGGSFTTLGGGGTGTTSRNYIGRLDADGSLDASFNPGANNFVLALAVQTDEKVVLGGNFSKLGGGTGTTTRNRIGRLNANGSLDTSFDPGVNNWVVVLALQTDEKILLGGQFTTLGGGGTGTTTRNFIGRLTVSAGAPSGLTGSTVGSTLNLSWTAPANGEPPTAYIIEAGSAPGWSDLANFSTGNTSTSFVGTGVPTGEYHLRVRSTNSHGTSSPSNEIRLIVGTVLPGAPSALRGWASGSTLSLAWEAPTTGSPASAYIIEVGSAAGLRDIAYFSTYNTLTSFSAPDVPNGRYFFRVSAANSAGTGFPSNEVLVVVGPPAPGPPSGLTWSSAGSTILLTWTAPVSGGAPTAYTIEAGSTAGLANLANFSTGNTATSYAAGGIGNGTYVVRVKASNTGGTSAASNEVPLVVGCTGAPGAPSSFHTILNSGGTVQFAWTAPSFAASSNGPTTYVLEAGSAPGFSNLAVRDLGGPATTVTIGGIVSGIYYVRVRARNDCGTSAASNEFQLIVP